MAESDECLEVLVIGIDAGCLPVLEPLAAAGVIPTIRSQLATGVVSSLSSQIPPWTASAWPSLYTGKNPGKHGVYDFLSFDGYDWDVVNATHVRERPIWELLSDYDHSSVVVNVPVTHPPREFDGALIPGMTAPEDPDCHPEGILADVKAACGDYYVYPQSHPAPDRSIEAYERTIEYRGAAFRYLCHRFDPDFGFLQFQQTDTVFHERPGDKDAIEAVYGAVDEQLATTIEETNPENILLVSDHGIGPVDGCEFRVNEFLRERGDVQAQSGGEGMPNWSREWENDLLEGEEAGPHTPSRVEQLMNLAARFGVTTQRVANTLEVVGLKEPIGRQLPNDLIRAASEQVDFPASRAYMRSKSELGIRLNLEGREPHGQVPPDAYEQVRRSIIADLQAVQTPDGEQLFEAVEPRETYFHGPELEKAPDIVTVPNAFDHALVAGLEGEQFDEPFEPWNHKRDGVLAATGPKFGDAVDALDPTIFDVAPTICSLFDIPIDEDMDGTVLPFVESSEQKAYPSYDADPIVATGDKAVEDRLSDLGYL